MRKVLLIVFIIAGVPKLFSQHTEEHYSFGAAGDQIIPLGLFYIGSAVHIECQVDGGWAEDGGIYHIVSDWGSLPKVIYRGESSISNRLRFYGYLPTGTSSTAFLFAKWENQSPGKSYTNTVRFTVFCEKPFDKNNVGDFVNAVELEDLLVVQASSSKVGIGTINPKAKLDVAGTIRATEIKVEAQSADFVFDEDYNLLDLNEVERFINENKHLPDIPSAAEMEESGVNLAEMNKLLLQKIEELTLYAIKKDKEVEELTTKFEEERTERQTLSERLSIVEEILTREIKH